MNQTQLPSQCWTDMRILLRRRQSEPTRNAPNQLPPRSPRSFATEMQQKINPETEPKQETEEKTEPNAEREIQQKIVQEIRPDTEREADIQQRPGTRTHAELESVLEIKLDHEPKIEPERLPAAECVTAYSDGKNGVQVQHLAGEREEPTEDASDALPGDLDKSGSENGTAHRPAVEGPTVVPPSTVKEPETERTASDLDPDRCQPKSDALSKAADPAPLAAESPTEHTQGRLHALTFAMLAVVVVLAVLLGFLMRGWIFPAVGQRLDRLDVQEQQRSSEFAQLAAELEQSPSDLDESTLSAARRLARTEEEWQKLDDVDMQAKQHSARLLSISAAVGDAGEYEAALQQYVMNYANTSRANDFQKALQNDVEFLKVLEQWNGLIDGHSLQTVRSLDPKDATDLYKRATLLLETCGGLPGSEFVRDFLLLHASARSNQSTENMQPLIGLLNERWVRARFVYEWTDGSRYYLTQEPAATSTGQRVLCRYFSDVASTERQIRLATAGLSDHIVDRGMSESLANLASVMDRLDTMDPKNWESSFIEIVSRVRSDDGFGIPAKIYLLREITRLACQGSPAFRKGFADYMEILEAVDFATDGSCIDPLSRTARAVKAGSEDAWRRLDRIHAHSVTSTWQALIDDAAEKVESILWCGWLYHDDGVWKCEGRRGLKNNEINPLYTVRRRSLREPLELTEIGRIDEISSRHNLIEGSPVVVLLGR